MRSSTNGSSQNHRAGGGSSNSKGKGRGGNRGGQHHGQRVRRAADYTPAQEPLANQAQIQAATRAAVERDELERERSRNAAAAAAQTTTSSNGEGDATDAAAAGVAIEPSSGPGGSSSNAVQQEDPEEPALCYICAEPVRYWMLGTCNHRTCHVCSLRLRALYKKRECTFCKLDLPTVLCTTDSETLFQDFPPDAFPCSDAKLGISFQSTVMMEDTLTLLRFNCPRLECDYQGSGWVDLKKHVRHEHDKYFCDLCTRYKKIFAHEHSLYSQHSLQRHTKEGDAAEDHEATGFSGHPMCEFCKMTFYDNDQLFEHCRDRHEQCFICLRNGTGRYQYYVDYPHLENHFQAAHYLCLNTQCLEKKFIVFDSEIDLQAHQLSEHGATTIGGGSGAGPSRAARRLETNFSYAAPTHDPRAGGGVSMRPRPSRTAEQQVQASQEQIAQVQAALPGPSNGVLGSRGRLVPGLQRGGFNTSLSSDEPSSKKEGKKPAHQNNTMGETLTGVKQTDPMMAARHASLLTRVSEAVGGSDSKLAAFRAAVKSYRSSESSAEDLIKTLSSILDDQVDLTGKIVYNTADLLDNNDKRIELLRSWDRQQGELLQSVDSFPSLVPTAPVSHFPGASASRPSPAARQAITKSTKQSSSAVWARVEEAAANKNVGAVPGLTHRAPTAARKVQSKDKFPALPGSQHAVSASAVRGVTPWASSRTQATSPGSTYFPVASAGLTNLLATPARTPAAARTPVASGSRTPVGDFPSLPLVAQAKARAAQKATLFPQKPEASGVKPWGAQSPPLSSVQAEDMQMQQALAQSLQDIKVNGDGQADMGAGKKKKKGKQVLLHYGL